MNEIPFFVTLSRKIKFNTIKTMTGIKRRDLFEACKRVIALYNKQGFVITDILFDLQFACIKDDLENLKVNFNLSSAQ